MSENKNTARPLWTRDFTIITAGSIVSMLGNNLAGFAMGLMVLDISGSTLLYAIYLAMYTLPQLVVPIISGAVLDRFSRKKTIYTLDFLSAALYAVMALVIASGWFSFPLFAAFCFILGCIESTYLVAYDSFYPLLISEGNYQKAYSIASVLETIATVMVPVSAFLYRQIGLSPLLGINALCFFTAAVIETRIRTDEKYIQTQKETLLQDGRKIRQVLFDIRDGFSYLHMEKGLFAIAVYFAFSSICGGASSVLVLPWFKGAFKNGEYIYMLVWGIGLAARALGGLLYYRFSIPPKRRFSLALAIYIIISVAEGIYLFTPVPAMMLLCFIIGLGGITTYTIRVSATQSYVPDERKGRFNGAFNMISTAGALTGELAAGSLTLMISERLLLLFAMLLCALAAVIFIGGNRKEVAVIYNRSQ